MFNSIKTELVYQKEMEINIFRLNEINHPRARTHAQYIYLKCHLLRTLALNFYQFIGSKNNLQNVKN